MKTLSFAGAVAAVMVCSAFGADIASAGAENLQCNYGFEKVETYSRSIKCRRTYDHFPSRDVAMKHAQRWTYSASCNAHSSPPKTSVMRHGGKWRARVSYICAIIQ